MVKPKLRTEHPYDSANFVSKGLFSWCIKYFTTVNNYGASEDLLFRPRIEDDAKTLGGELCYEIEVQSLKELQFTTLKLIKYYFRHSGTIIKSMYVALVFVGLRTMTLLMLNFLMFHMAVINPTNIYNIATILIMQLFYIICLFSGAFLQESRQFWFNWAGERIRIAFTVAIYRKLTQLPVKVVTPELVRNIISLIRHDILIFTQVPTILKNIIIAPLLLAVATLLLYLTMGFASLFGIVVYMGLAFPLTIFSAYKSAKIQTRISMTDTERFDLMFDILQGVETIKMNCLNEVFLEKTELVNNLQRRQYHMQLFYNTIIWMTSNLLYQIGTVVTIVLFLMQKNILAVDKLFFCLLIYEHFLSFCIKSTADAITLFYKVQIVLHKVNSLLSLPEILHNTFERIENCYSIEFENVSTELIGRHAPVRDLTLTIPEGKLTVICGTFHSGHTSIIPILTDEVRVRSGTIRIGGRISHYFKSVLIVGESFKYNITLGRAFNKHHYQFIKKLCGLNSEFSQFNNGDEFILNNDEYWLSLEYKVMLARALYEFADIYVFDDPAIQIVNSRGRLVFEDCIFKYLSDVTRLIVTNQEYYVKNADQVCFFDNGQLVAQGTVTEVRKHVPDFNVFLKYDLENKKVKKARFAVSQRSFYIMPKETPIFKRLTGAAPLLLFTYRKLALGKYFEKGDLFKSLWTLLVFITLSVIVNKVGVYIIINFATKRTVNKQVARWGSQEFFSANNNTVDFENLDEILSVPDIRAYIIISLTMIPILTFFYIITTFLFSKCNKRVFPKIFGQFLRAKMDFVTKVSVMDLFEAFARDNQKMTIDFPEVFLSTCVLFSDLLVLIMMFIVLNYYTGPIYLTYAIAVWSLLRWYKRCCKCLLIFEYRVFYPIGLLIEQTSSRLNVLRKSKIINHYTNEFVNEVNKHSSVKFMLLALQRAVSLWFTLITILAMILCFGVYMWDLISNRRYNKNITFTMYYMMVIISSAYNGVNEMFVILNNNVHMNTMYKYEALDGEDLEKGLRYPKIWLSPPLIVYKNVTASVFGYGGIKDFSVEIAPGEHVGLIGRVGSGRREIINILTQLYEYEGIILLNDRDIKTINVCTLRRNIFFISTSTQLFAPNIRFNLDPRREFTETLLIDALNRVGLKADLLDFSVEPLGLNITTETKLLILLARSLLMRNKILIIDNIFDKLARQVRNNFETIIFNEFAECTILILDTKLNFVTRCSRIIVMDRGHIMDDDNTESMFARRYSYVYTVVDKSGYIDSTRFPLS